MNSKEMLKFLDKILISELVRTNNFYGHIDGDMSFEQAKASELGQKIECIKNKLTAAENLVNHLTDGSTWNLDTLFNFVVKYQKIGNNKILEEKYFG